MPTKKSTVKVEWDPETEERLERKIDTWAGKCCNTKTVKGGSNAVYGFGLIGALIYFISTAHSFGEGLLGILKAIVWPGYIVFELLKYFKI